MLNVLVFTLYREYNIVPSRLSRDYNVMMSVITWLHMVMHTWDTMNINWMTSDQMVVDCRFELNIREEELLPVNLRSYVYTTSSTIRYPLVVIKTRNTVIPF